MSHDTLIGADALLALLAGAEPPLVLDASFDLGDPAAGERSFAAAHIPGSLYAHLDRDLCAAKTGRNGRHPLPERTAFARTAGAFGITPGTQVVALDRQGGMYAARLWWMLRWLGHDRVAVLDGGFVAWLAAGGRASVDAGVARSAPAYPDRPPLAGSVDAATLSTLLGRTGARRRPLARALPRRPRADRSGRRPHPRRAQPLQREQSARRRFKAPELLRAEFQALLGDRPPGEVIHSCGSGVTACHNLLAMEHAGLHGSLLYPGSWSEWSSDPARPIARG